MSVPQLPIKMPQAKIAAKPIPQYTFFFSMFTNPQAQTSERNVVQAKHQQRSVPILTTKVAKPVSTALLSIAFYGGWIGSCDGFICAGFTHCHWIFFLFFVFLSPCIFSCGILWREIFGRNILFVVSLIRVESGRCTLSPTRTPKYAIVRFKIFHVVDFQILVFVFLTQGQHSVKKRVVVARQHT